MKKVKTTSIKRNFSEDDLKIVFENQQHRCHRCGKILEFEKQTEKFVQEKKDHWSSHRFFNGSPYDANNCVILCNECGYEYVRDKKYILSPNNEIIDSAGNVKDRKSMVAGLLLTFFFGALGLLYSNIRVAFVLLLLRIIAWTFLGLSVSYDVSLSNNPLFAIALVLLCTICLASNRIILMIVAGISISNNNKEISKMTVDKTVHNAGEEQ